ncbi:UPF0178 protein [Polymorphobacter multimanifer]|uniref:YaiI/YqxD family protein n=1 Tax=Polymorphobacter multimanifer TaxID=1070431 RepID=UPI00166C3F2C|nr:YaiI/YqxD family protein [Polymorphobacter multimanifer]GGI89318.1 UPF0178 protein [Polymorphobacter multimanifer]
MKIYVDADACPVKDEVYRVAIRHGIAVVAVSNSGHRMPAHPLVSQHMVGPAFDAADDWITEAITPGDVVVTGDILLAERVLKAGASAVAHDGRIFTSAMIGSAVAQRALMADLRAGMVGITGGPPAFSKADRSRFLQALDLLLVRAQNQAGGS